MRRSSFISLPLMTQRLSVVFLFVMVVAMPLTQAATPCTAESGAVRVPLLELYTSEGCDSCPSADRWVSSLRQRGYAPDRALVLAWHVDYWDRLGWAGPIPMPKRDPVRASVMPITATAHALSIRRSCCSKVRITGAAFSVMTSGIALLRYRNRNQAPTFA